MLKEISVRAEIKSMLHPLLVEKIEKDVDQCRNRARTTIRSAYSAARNGDIHPTVEYLNFSNASDVVLAAVLAIACYKHSRKLRMLQSSYLRMGLGRYAVQALVDSDQYAFKASQFSAFVQENK